MEDQKKPKTKLNLSLRTRLRLFWLTRIKEQMWCRFFHRKHHCHPQDPNGAWHCSECTPCGISFDLLDEHCRREKESA